MKLTDRNIRNFWKKVNVKGTDDCWTWTASRMGSGYGLIRINKKSCGAHRVSWIIANKRDIPPNMIIGHHCDNKLCVNPSHLFIGTQSDNMWDMIRKGRAPVRHGESCGMAKLSKEEVLEIFYSDDANNQITGDKYGISDRHVSRIKNKKRWQHLTKDLQRN